MKERKEMPRKITIIASCLVLVLYSGCVSQDKYGKLETEHNSTQTQMEEDKENLIKLQAQNKQLLSENQRLLKTIDELNLKLDSEKSADEQTEKIISKTAPSTDESGSYSILLSSCQLQESVQKVLSNYKETDLEPFVVKVDLGEKGIWWRIFSGHFATRESANDEKDNSGLSDKIVLKATQADSTLAHDDENETVNNDSLLVKREL
ncbi:MAG: hypothetical protein GY850_04320 [bacterium]|nr:hypothetical protein [bacterium]